MKKYVINLLISIDQLVNTVFGGDPDETISSRVGKRPNCRICRALCWLLDRLDPDHCRDSREFDEGKDEVIG